MRLLLGEGVVSVQVGSEFRIAVGSHDYWSEVSIGTIHAANSTFPLPLFYFYACTDVHVAVFLAL